MKTIVNYSKRPYVYASILTIGIMMLYTIVRTTNPVQFIFGALSLYLLLLFEIYTTKYYVLELNKQLALENRSIKHRKAHWIHHLILPTILFLSLVLFILVNSQINMLLLLTVLSFVLFSFMFINIKAYYERRYMIENRTANIYDVISISSIFMLVYSLLILTGFFGNSFLLTLLLNTFVLGVMGYLVLSRYDLSDLKGLLILMFLLFVYINSFLLLLNFEITVLLHTVIATFGFYYFTVIVNHLSEKTLTLKVILEYLVVFILIFVIIILGNI